MTADKLKEIAEKAFENKYESIISALKDCALRGKNSYIIDDAPDILVKKLQEKGYTIQPIFKYNYNLFLQRKKKKLFLIKF